MSVNPTGEQPAAAPQSFAAAFLQFEQDCQSCRNCPLGKHAVRPLFGAVREQARLMLIGEGRSRRRPARTAPLWRSRPFARPLADRKRAVARYLSYLQYRQMPSSRKSRSDPGGGQGLQAAPGPPVSSGSAESNCSFRSHGLQIFHRQQRCDQQGARKVD